MLVHSLQHRANNDPTIAECFMFVGVGWSVEYDSDSGIYRHIDTDSDNGTYRHIDTERHTVGPTDILTLTDILWDLQTY